MTPSLDSSQLSRTTRLLGVVFVLLLAIPALAGDNDPDWGLPGPIQNPVGKSEEVSLALAVSGDFVASELLSTAGRVDVTLDGADAVDLMASDESVDPVLMAHASGLRHAPVPGGQAVQGAADLNLADGMHATLRAPASAVTTLTLLTLDVGVVNLDTLVASQGLGIVSILPLGAFDELDLGKLQSLVAHHASALESAYGAPIGVSVIVLSFDGQGATHVSAGRVMTDGGAIEVFAE